MPNLHRISNEDFGHNIAADACQPSSKLQMPKTNRGVQHVSLKKREFNHQHARDAVRTPRTPTIPSHDMFSQASVERNLGYLLPSSPDKRNICCKVATGSVAIFHFATTSCIAGDFKRRHVVLLVEKDSAYAGQDPLRWRL